MRFVRPARFSPDKLLSQLSKEPGSTRSAQWNLLNQLVVCHRQATSLAVRAGFDAGENLGSGFPLILNAWNERHWLKPELIEQPELMQVKLILHILSEPINEPINEDLTERQQAILTVIKRSPSLNRYELAEKANLSLATLKREITLLRNNGYIGRDGSNKNGKWILLKDFTKANVQ